jgi:hypothetical protein
MNDGPKAVSFTQVGQICSDGVGQYYSGGDKQENVSDGDLFYWPPGHTVRVRRDAEVILFSPQAEHCAVIEHIRAKLAV